jgi:hypothetical protein
MIEIVLTEPQLDCLKAAVSVGSEESAALQPTRRFGRPVFSPEAVSVTCTLAIGNRLLSVAQQFCPDIVPAILAAIELRNP